MAAPRLLSHSPPPIEADAELDTFPAVLEFAGMGERLLAFFCDSSASIILTGAFLALFYSQTSVDFESLEQWTLPLMLIAYMTVTEYYFHGSIGKRLLGLQVRADTSQPKYPSFFQLLLRESVGKFACSVVLGIGFLAGSSNAKHKTWADRMVGTVVVKVNRITGLRKLLLIPVIVGSFYTLQYALKEIPVMYQARIDQQLVATERKVDDLHVEVIKSFIGPEPHSAGEYQQSVAKIPAMLKEYDRLLEKEEELTVISRKFLKPGFSEASIRLSAYEKLVPLRRRVSQAVSRHLRLVLAFDAQKQSFDDVIKDRKRMLQNVKDSNDLINEIGGMYLTKTIEY